MSRPRAGTVESAPGSLCTSVLPSCRVSGSGKGRASPAACHSAPRRGCWGAGAGPRGAPACTPAGRPPHRGAREAQGCPVPPGGWGLSAQLPQTRAGTREKRPIYPWGPSAIVPSGRWTWFRGQGRAGEENVNPERSCLCTVKAARLSEAAFLFLRAKCLPCRCRFQTGSLLSGPLLNRPLPMRL